MNSGGVIIATLIDNGVDRALAARLGHYGDLVLEANRTTNLTGAREPEKFAAQILDSLTLAADIDGPLIDIGSGAGLPGIPLALSSGRPIVLVESIKKKALFLARVLGELKVTGDVVDRRAEDLGSDRAFRERFRCATARAVATAPTVAEFTVPFLAIGGRALLQRGSMSDREREALADAAPMLGAEFVAERVLGGDRRILVLEKKTMTPARFPRRSGIPEKRPLCFI